MEAFGIKPFEHIINSLVCESSQNDTLTLLVEPFDDLGDNAGFTRAGRAVNEQVVLHSHGTFDCQILFAVEVCSRWNDDHGIKLWLYCAGHESAQVRISL